MEFVCTNCIIECVCCNLPLLVLFAHFVANGMALLSNPIAVFLLCHIFLCIVIRLRNSLAIDCCIVVSRNMPAISNCCSNHLGIMMTVDIFQYKLSAVLLKFGVWS